MGLDALVNLRKENLPFDADALGATFDGETGDCIFPSDELQQLYGGETSNAACEHLGSATHINNLRRKLRGVLDPNSIVLSRILYSGTHFGDIIGVADLDQLQRELRTVLAHAKAKQAHNIVEFASTMRVLIRAARKQNYPIVFS